MMTRTLPFALLLVGLLAPAAVGAAPSAAEQARIEYLIASIEKLDGAMFVRNGSAHTAAEAADHMRRKLRAAGNRIETAEQFIDRVATRSSMSGVKYLIKMKDGTVVEAGVFLREQLAKQP